MKSRSIIIVAKLIVYSDLAASLLSTTYLPTYLSISIYLLYLVDHRIYQLGIRWDADNRPGDDGAWGHVRCASLMMRIADDGRRIRWRRGR